MKRTSKKAVFLVILCIVFSWSLVGTSVVAKGKAAKLTLNFDEVRTWSQPKKVTVKPLGQNIPYDIYSEQRGTGHKGIGFASYETPPKDLNALINLKNIALIDVAEIAKNGGKELAPEIKVLMAKGYKFYCAELGITLGPSTKYEFVVVELTYELPSGDSGTPYVKVFNIFPQTTYEEQLKISGSVGLDLSLGYKVPQIPLDASVKASLLVQPKPWVWQVATIQATGIYTPRAAWIFKVDKTSADLQTQMILISKAKPPFYIKIKGDVEVSPGAWQKNYHFTINSDAVELSE